MDLSVKLGELELKNPVMIAAGPWTRDPESLKTFIKAGASAVITESITMDANAVVHPYMHVNGNQFFNVKLHSHLYLEQWEDGLAGLDMEDCKLICSIWGSTVSEVRYLSNYVERLGADAVELSLYAPIGSRNQTMCTTPDHIANVIREIVREVDIPVLIKLPYEISFFPEMLQAIYDAGARVVSAIDALRGLSGVDLETMRTPMPTYGGYTGECIRPVSLATTAMLKQYTPFYICGCGGITGPHEALEYMMLGANAVQLASAIFEKGTSVIGETVRGIENWLSAHGYRSVEEIYGLALQQLRPFEDVPRRPVHAAFASPCNDETCDICRRGCIYHAVTHLSDGYRIHPEICGGCGYCVGACPQSRIVLKSLPPTEYR